MTAFLTKDARRAIINRCASHLSARFAGRAFAVAAFTNDVSPRNLSPFSVGEGVALLGHGEGTPASLLSSFHSSEVAQ